MKTSVDQIIFGTVLILFLPIVCGAQVSTALEIDTVSWDGIAIKQTGNDGIDIAEAGDAGVRVSQALNGFWVTNAGNPSSQNIPGGSRNGFTVAGAEGFGLQVGHADFSGVFVNSASLFGIHARGNQAAGFFEGVVGINEPTPENELEIMGTSSNGVAGFTRSDLTGSAKSHILHGANGDWYIRPALNTGKIVVADHGGNVGIGLSNPSSLLHLKQPSGDLSIQMKTSNSWTAAITQSPSSLLSFHNGGSERMTIKHDGNVGIGTNSPNERLDVNGNVEVSGEVQRPATGSANLLPICYGVIYGDGTISGGTGNFSVTVNAQCQFDISIDNVSFNVTTGEFAVMVTPLSTSTEVGYSSIGGTTLRIFAPGLAGSCGAFSFFVYRY